MRSSRLVLPAVVACLLLGTTACSGPLHVGEGIGSTPSRLHVAQVGSVHPGRGDPVQIVRSSSIPRNEDEWEVVALDPLSDQLHVVWADGPSPECGQSDQILVHESATAITVGLHSTYSGPGETCAASAVPRSRTIPLRAAIGKRALLEYVPDGVNADYSFVEDADRLPVPQHCLRGSSERNAPVGALDAAERIVPFAPTRALICPEDPHGTEQVITSPRALADLTRVLNAGKALELNQYGFPSRCTRDRSVFYDLYLSNATAAVQVTAGDGGCLAISNGIRTTALPEDLPQRLRGLTASKN